MQAARAAIAYFGLVFGAGFVLGLARVLLLTPRLGARASELLEAPLMLIVIYWAASWVVKRVLRNPGVSVTLSTGLLALGLVLLADVGVGVLLRGMTLRAVFMDRDPLAGAAYYLNLAAFAIMPTLLACRRCEERMLPG